jgi:lysophospholipase L1-like esterase
MAIFTPDFSSMANGLITGWTWYGADPTQSYATIEEDATPVGSKRLRLTGAGGGSNPGRNSYLVPDALPTNIATFDVVMLARLPETGWKTGFVWHASTSITEYIVAAINGDRIEQGRWEDGSYNLGARTSGGSHPITTEWYWMRIRYTAEPRLFVTASLDVADIELNGSGVPNAGWQFERTTSITLTGASSGAVGLWQWQTDAKDVAWLSIGTEGDYGETPPPGPPWELSTSVVGQGTVARDPDGSPYADETVVELTALPAPGWEFTEWTGSLTGTTNPDTITMDGQKDVTAVFTFTGEGVALGNVMPTGDSITRGWSGFASGTQGTYRRWLILDLDARSNTYDMVGPNSSHPSGDYLDQGLWDHDCFAAPGDNYDDIYNNIAARVTTYDPDLILLYIGINDLRHDGSGMDATTAIGELEKCIVNARAAKPTVDFLVAELAPPLSTSTSGPSTIARLEEYNPMVRALCESLDSTFSRVLAVDCFTGFGDTDLDDNVHPNEDGDKKIAAAFDDGIIALASSEGYDYFDLDVEPGGTYIYRVRATDDSELEHTWSETREITLSGGAVITGIIFVGADREVSGSWSPFPDAVEYGWEVEELDGSDPELDPWIPFASAQDPATSMYLGEADGIKANTYYRLRVRPFTEP